MAKTAVDYAKRAPFNKTAFTAAYTTEFKGVAGLAERFERVLRAAAGGTPGGSSAS